MTLFSVLAALLWEFLQPPREPSPPVVLFRRYAEWLLRHLNTGLERHGVLAWVAAVLLPALAVAGLGALLGSVLGLLEWGWNLLVLYFCLGFRQISLEVAELVHALWHADREQARRILIQTFPEVGLVETEQAIAAASVEHTLRQSVERLFGVLFWFGLLGPFGAVAYRLTGMCRSQWQGETGFCACAGKLAYYLDWLPLRAAAFSFAIVGNFEGALSGWRERAAERDGNDADRLLAAGTGALGMRPGKDSEEDVEDAQQGGGEPAGPEHVAATVNLVWRAVVLWLAVLGLLWLGGL